jgi:GntR family transcriptional regulator
MNFKISSMSQTPIYEQLKSQIKELILTGQLEAGEQLPSIRLMAKDLKIGIITCRRAYDDLCEEGFLVSHPGKGVFVAEIQIEKVKLIHRQMLKEQLQDIYVFAIEAGFQKAEIIEVICEIYLENKHSEEE